MNTLTFTSKVNLNIDALLCGYCYFPVLSYSNYLFYFWFQNSNRNRECLDFSSKEMRGWDRGHIPPKDPGMNFQAAIWPLSSWSLRWRTGQVSKTLLSACVEMAISVLGGSKPHWETVGPSVAGWYWWCQGVLLLLLLRSWSSCGFSLWWSQLRTQGEFDGKDSLEGGQGPCSSSLLGTVRRKGQAWSFRLGNTLVEDWPLGQYQAQAPSVQTY